VEKEKFAVNVSQDTQNGHQLIQLLQMNVLDAQQVVKLANKPQEILNAMDAIVDITFITIFV